ncbi:glycoside hydrolase [Jimgerdemannia flammicorona]|uniref:Glycoside hydrolase n=2 Tax=Jimgerdemannia flammicorona TaxID=994334 RepID=A0A433DH61_9FUNG|nr:glycoside hydrolase [Jimgerdemannia flammicorona]RUS35266.1 glycoside hydrolase [Jimgerdemannia flammicorona]
MKSLSLFTLTLLSAHLAAAQRMVGYYGIFATGANCTGIPRFVPELVPAHMYTHLNFAFSNITDDFQMGVTNPGTDEAMYARMNALKKINTQLKTAVVVGKCLGRAFLNSAARLVSQLLTILASWYCIAGGWSMNMSYYSLLVSSAQNRATFIASSLKFVRQYGFDGIDFDWEYPSDTTRGGQATDPQNLVLFMKELRAAVNAETLTNGTSRLTLSIALPGGPYHGQYFLNDQLAQYVDWFNLMAYNLHGSWESIAECAAPLYDPAVGTAFSGYSVNNAFTSMVPTSVDPAKFNLGISFSGDTFTLNTSQTTPGSSASGPGTVGWCTKEAGTMAYFEIKTLLSGGNATAAVDTVGVCSYLTYTSNSSQWVGYDDPSSFNSKVDFLKAKGMGGISVWAMDADTTDFELTTAVTTRLYNKQGWLNNVIPSNGTKSGAGSLAVTGDVVARVVVAVIVAVVAGFAL